MLIIFISFTLLSVIVASLINEYSLETKSSSVLRSAFTAKQSIEFNYSNYKSTNFHEYIDYDSLNLETTVTMLANYSDDLYIFITDKGGNIVLTCNSMETPLISEAVPRRILNSIFETGEFNEVGTLESTLASKHLVYGVPIYDAENEPKGAVFSCSSSLGLDAFVKVMIKTIITTSLWVLLAALVAVYFISERIIAPLKNMSRAAKSFASGKFDVRIPVTGRDEVAELAIAFNNMADSLTNVEDMRRSFLANVSHDLRTPMTTISGFIDNITAGIIPPEKHAYYLDIISKEVRRLSRLVTSLLDISRIQAGERKFTMAPFDICEMARIILISFEQTIDKKKLDVEFDSQAPKMLVNADKDAIYQILYNICDNGVKFSREGGKYKISITKKDKKVVVSVFNEGEGIPEKDLPYVFERFYKSDKSRGLDKTGVGLGMYIAKTIIDAHGEEISVKSVHGENCEFSFTLPYVYNVK